MNTFRILGALLLATVIISGCSKQPTGSTEPNSLPATTHLEKSQSSPHLSSNETPILNPANGHYYEAISVSGGITWDDANAAAAARKFRSYEGHLAVVTSQAENDFLVTSFPNAFPANRPGFWLGGFQQLPSAAPDQGWTWVTGEPFTFTNWLSGEPNDAFVEEDVLHFHCWGAPAGAWNDLPRSYVVPGFFVEYERHLTVTICHKPGTPAQKTLVIPIQALAAHLAHGDVIGTCCDASKGAEYVISGGADPSTGIFVDDILRVFVNGNLVAEVSQGGRCCPPEAPIHFIADTGDLLRVQAQDANNCYSLEALWLQRADGSCLTQLTENIGGPNCGSEPPEQIFFDQTFTLP